MKAEKTPKQIAERLTEAQRKAVLSASTEWKRVYGPGTGAYQSAGVRKLIDYSGWPGRSG
jgi:hypothetical protein